MNMAANCGLAAVMAARATANSARGVGLLLTASVFIRSTALRELPHDLWLAGGEVLRLVGVGGQIKELHLPPRRHGLGVEQVDARQAGRCAVYRQPEP